MPTKQGHEAYHQPAIYDLVNTPGTAREVDLFETLAARFVLRDDSRAGRLATRRLVWFEPGCGSGRYLRVIAGRMAKQVEPVSRPVSDLVGPVSRPVSSVRSPRGLIIGLDLSQDMLDYAHSRLPRTTTKHVRLIRADMRRIPMASFPRKVDFAFCPHNSVRHLQTERDLVAHLRSVSRLLSRRGVYAVGLELTAGLPLQPTESLFRASRGGTTVRQFFSYLPPEPGDSPPVETVIISTEVERTIRGRRTAHHEDTSYPLRSWTVPEWHAMVKRAGLEEIAVTDVYGKLLRPTYTRYANRILRLTEPRE